VLTAVISRLSNIWISLTGSERIEVPFFGAGKCEFQPSYSGPLWISLAVAIVGVFSFGCNIEFLPDHPGSYPEFR